MSSPRVREDPYTIIISLGALAVSLVAAFQSSLFHKANLDVQVSSTAFSLDFSDTKKAPSYEQSIAITFVNNGNVSIGVQYVDPTINFSEKSEDANECLQKNPKEFAAVGSKMPAFVIKPQDIEIRHFEASDKELIVWHIKDDKSGMVAYGNSFEPPARLCVFLTMDLLVPHLGPKRINYSLGSFVRGGEWMKPKFLYSNGLVNNPYREYRNILSEHWFF